METKSDILKELEGLSPKLAEMQKNTPFKVPENYFSGLDERILSVIKADSLENELKEASQLQALKGAETPFNVPYQYFERLPDKILEKVSRKKSVVESVQEYFQYSFRISHLVAAMPVAAMIVVAIFIFKFRPAQPDATAYNQNVTLTAQEIQVYLDKNVTSIDEQTIVERLAVKDVKSLSHQKDTRLDVSDPSLIDISQVDLSSIQDL